MGEASFSLENYDLFFQRLREGKYQDFTSIPEADPDG